MNSSDKNSQAMLLRADAGPNIGVGHVMRCLALAQAWQDSGGRAIFACAELPLALEERLHAENIETVRLKVEIGTKSDAEKTAALASQIGGSWIVADGYALGNEWQGALKTHVQDLQLLALDDFGHARHEAAKVVLNQNAGAQSCLPCQKEGQRLLLGPRYALLRREFASWHSWQRQTTERARRILVTLGGGDPANISLRVLGALEKLGRNDWEAVVVVGGASPHWDVLQKSAKSLAPYVRLERNISQMPELLAWADVGVTASGSTCWETCFLGLPCLLLILADNQNPIAQFLDAAGIAQSLGWGESISSEQIAEKLNVLALDASRRESMSQKGRNLVDGWGAHRVVSVLQGEPVIEMCPVEETDCRLLWEWVNDPAVRAASFSSEFVAWEDHQAWFTRKLADPLTLMLLARNAGGEAVGQVRFDEENGVADIDVSVAPQKRGRGLGEILLREGLRALWRQTGAQTARARIKPENLASQRAFAAAGFSRCKIAESAEGENLEWHKKRGS